MQGVVLRPVKEISATWVSLKAQMERVHSDGAIPPGRKYFLLMALTYSSPFLIQEQATW
jgi:hypothetical protein